MSRLFASGIWKGLNEWTCWELCWPTSKKASNDSCLLAFLPPCPSLAPHPCPHWIGWPVKPTGYCWNDGLWISRQGQKTSWGFCSRLILSEGSKPPTTPWGLSSSPVEKSGWQRTWSLLPTASTTSPASGVNCLRWVANSLACNLRRDGVRTVQWSRSQLTHRNCVR